MAMENETVVKKDAEAPAKTTGNGIDPKSLAGLCYIPFLLINIIVSLYVLLSGKGGRFAKFHAMQALLLAMAYFALGQLLMIPYYLAFGALYASVFSGVSGGRPPGPEMLGSMGGMFMLMAPVMLLGVAFLIYSIFLAFKAFGGEEVRVPVIGRYAEKFAGN